MALSTLLLPADEPAATATPAHTPAWLENAVFYQIYPQTYRDSNGDGIGDLRGIIEKLPYLHELGVTALWLSPCYDSPFGDAGYDVADFYKVAPRYGTNDDLRALFAEAKKVGIRVMLDLVAGHTSNQCEWFRQSQRHERNPYTDWYIWNDNVWDWFTPGLQLVVGGAERAANYVPNFFHFQPALNYGFAQPDPKAPWQQPITAPGPQAVRAELKKIMRFWFDLGAAGFRVDMAGSLVKNDPDGKATAALWAEFRAWMNTEYPDRAMVSEWSQPQIAIPNGFHMDFLLPFAKPGYKALFRPDGAAVPIFDRSGKNSIRTFLDEFEPLYTATRGQGFIAIPSGNHDTVPRLGNGRDPRDLAVAMAFLLTMPGVPFIYYGDELGLRALDGLPSKEGGYGRTGCRTPMQWDASANAGFSTASAAALYLPVDPAADRPNVAAELAYPDSALRATQQLIALRKAHPSLAASGDFQVLVAEKDRWPFVFRRAKGDEVIVVALNPTDQAVTATLPAAVVAQSLVPLAGTSDTFRREGDTWLVTLPPVSYTVVRVAE
ncbi:MAG: alpha-glucosidase C-terminal domain-containing protein [Opitutaceae bacterium]|nr:alpha-glucosidase C-terminal domain-containing protein [Opitutaceae bacterium]